MGDVVTVPHVGVLGDDEGNNQGKHKLERGSNELSIRTRVSLDGEAMDLQISRGADEGLLWVLSFGEACLAYHEIRASLGVATGRQRMTKELAREAIADLCRTALRPSALGYQVDAETGDIFIIHFFDEHAPFCVRVSQQQLQEGRAQVIGLLAKTAH